jgi:hypothetical protein
MSHGSAPHLHPCANQLDLADLRRLAASGAEAALAADPALAKGPHAISPLTGSRDQLSIEMERRFPEVRAALGHPFGGVGAGGHNSLVQY